MQGCCDRSRVLKLSQEANIQTVHEFYTKFLTLVPHLHITMMVEPAPDVSAGCQWPVILAASSQDTGSHFPASKRPLSTFVSPKEEEAG